MNNKKYFYLYISMILRQGRHAVLAACCPRCLIYLIVKFTDH